MAPKTDDFSEIERVASDSENEERDQERDQERDRDLVLDLRRQIARVELRIRSTTNLIRGRD